MLVINNGVPKSGSTWIQQILSKMLNPSYPSKDWRNNWKNPSIAPERLEAYFKSREWEAAPTLIKMHIINGPEYAFLGDPGVRMLVSSRNIPDSVLSWFYMSVRLGNARIEEKQEWLAGQGVTFAHRLIEHRNSWVGVPNVLALKYEEILEQPAIEVMKIAGFVNFALTNDDAKKIIEATQVKLSEGEKPRDDSHFRTGGRSLGKEEIAPETYERLVEIEARGALA